MLRLPAALDVVIATFAAFRAVYNMIALQRRAQPEGDMQPFRETGLAYWWFKLKLTLSYVWLLILLGLPLLFFVVAKGSNPHGWTPAPEGAWAGTPLDYVSLQWIAMFSSAMFFGALGATVSFFSRSDLGAGQIDKPRSLGGTQVFGAVFATILMLTFLGGLIQGSLFPEMGTGVRWRMLIFDVSAWAKLMVWSFVAGFSERFVPDLLNNLIRRVEHDEEKKEEFKRQAGAPTEKE